MEGTNSNLNEVRQLVADDYLDLWKYFQGRADDLKERMFESVTWITGFAAADLAFIYGKFVDLSGPTVVVKAKWPVIFFCLIGILLCFYAGLVLVEYADHIIRNWARSGQCEKHIDGLSDLIKSAPDRKTAGVIMTIMVWIQAIMTDKAWIQIGIVVLLFALAFVLTAVFLLGIVSRPLFFEDIGLTI